MSTAQTIGILFRFDGDMALSDRPIAREVQKQPANKRQTGLVRGEIATKEEAAEVSKKRDRALVRLAKKGDRQAFKELVTMYEGRAKAVALGIMGNRDDADDIVQEAFVKAYRNIASFRGQSSFYTWLYRIIHNLSIDASRRAYRRYEVSTDDSARLDYAASQGTSSNYIAHVDNPDQYMRRVEIRKRFSEALSSLSPEHRAVITLREIDGLSYSEISDVVGCTKGTVMSRLHHARKKLQSLLADLMAEDEIQVAQGEDISGDKDGVR
jgi:RNA polymerase sigma-70 factor (ECF subfamily)